MLPPATDSEEEDNKMIEIRKKETIISFIIATISWLKRNIIDM